MYIGILSDRTISYTQECGSQCQDAHLSSPLASPNCMDEGLHLAGGLSRGVSASGVLQYTIVYLQVNQRSCKMLRKLSIRMPSGY